MLRARYRHGPFKGHRPLIAFASQWIAPGALSVKSGESLGNLEEISERSVSRQYGLCYMQEWHMLKPIRMSDHAPTVITFNREIPEGPSVR